MRSTQTMRDLWGTPCQSGHAGLMHDAYKALDQVFHHHGYKPRPGVCGGFVCRVITGGTKPSLHSFRELLAFIFWTGVKVTMAVAVDINWNTNPYGSRLVTDMARAMIDDVTAIRTVYGLQVWRWGGDWDGDPERPEDHYDAMHFELQVSPAELARGIDWSTVAGSTPPPPLPRKEITVKTTTIELVLPTVQIGDKGEAVRRLQDLLAKYCNQKVKVNGAFDQPTQVGVNNVKKLMNTLSDHQVPLDGICGPNVWEFLAAAAFGAKQIGD